MTAPETVTRGRAGAPFRCNLLRMMNIAAARRDLDTLSAQLNGLEATLADAEAWELRDAALQQLVALPGLRMGLALLERRRLAFEATALATVGQELGDVLQEDRPTGPAFDLARDRVRLFIAQQHAAEATRSRRRPGSGQNLEP